MLHPLPMWRTRTSIHLCYLCMLLLMAMDTTLATRASFLRSERILYTFVSTMKKRLPRFRKLRAGQSTTLTRLGIGGTSNTTNRQTDSNTFSPATDSWQDSILTQSPRPLKVLFLSSDTGGGHRASAEALGKQFAIQFPGSTYVLIDVWTDHGVWPYRTLIDTYKKVSAQPWKWRCIYHFSNNRLTEYIGNFHSKLCSGRRIYERIRSEQPDVVISVHPTMNHTPLSMTQQLGKDLGKHIPFFTVVTDLGSGHGTWFEKSVDRLYVASDRLFRLARRQGGTPARNIVRSGLPIRHEFGIAAKALGNRMDTTGLAYQAKIRQQLGLVQESSNMQQQQQQQQHHPVILIMGGGEGVGALSEIVNQIYTQLTRTGMEATICVVCGRNEKLKASLENRDWTAVVEKTTIVTTQPTRQQRIRTLLTRAKRKVMKRLFSKYTHGKSSDKQRIAPTRTSFETAGSTLARQENKSDSKVKVVALGFVTNMPDYMVAADILVTKAGPGTIAEAAAVGLPVILTSFLPGQEAGNVDVVLECGFGTYQRDPTMIGKEVVSSLQNPDKLEAMSLAAQKAGNPNAANEIVADIGRQTIAWMHLNEA